MGRWKAEQGRGREKRKSKKKEDADARKGRKVAKHCVFPMVWGSGGSKSRLAKAAGAEPAGQMRDEKLHAVVARSTFWSQNVTKHTSSGPLLAVEMSKKCTPLWREAHFQVKMYKTRHVRITFGSWDVEKVHAVVARSTFPSQNVQNTTCSHHFWRFGCWKSARRCGAKHISKSKCTKHPTCSRHFWRFGCRKSARRCGAKHISKSKCTKHHMFAPLLEVRRLIKVHAVVARSTFRSQNVKNTRVSDHFWRFRCRFASLHYMTLHYTPLHCIALHYTTLHYTTTTTTTTLHYTPLHSTTLHYTPLHSTTLNHTTLHYTTVHSTTRHYTTLHYTTLPSTTLH